MLSAMMRLSCARADDRCLRRSLRAAALPSVLHSRGGAGMPEERPHREPTSCWQVVLNYFLAFGCLNASIDGGGVAEREARNSSQRSVFATGFFPISCLTSVGEATVDETEYKPLLQERRSNLIDCDGVGEGEAKKPLHLESTFGDGVAKKKMSAMHKYLERAPAVEAPLSVENTTHRVDNINSCNRLTFVQRSVSSCFGCMNCRQFSDDECEQSETNYSEPSETREASCPSTTLVKIRPSEQGVSVEEDGGEQVGAFSAQSIAAAVQRTVAHNFAEYLTEAGIAAEKMIIVDIAGPGQPPVILEGLLRQDYKPMVFEVCPPIEWVE